MSDNKTAGQKLWENLSYNCPNVWNKIGNDEIKNTFAFCEEYKSFLDKSKTEREFVRETKKLAESKGFVSIDDVIDSGNR